MELPFRSLPTALSHVPGLNPQPWVARIDLGEPHHDPSKNGAVTSDQTGLMIIRTWIEPGSSEPLRAKVRIVTDASAGIEQTMMFGRVDAVCAAVQAWLDTMSVASAAE